jgi:hypothetical protein
MDPVFQHGSSRFFTEATSAVGLQIGQGQAYAISLQVEVITYRQKGCNYLVMVFDAGKL